MILSLFRWSFSPLHWNFLRNITIFLKIFNLLLIIKFDSLTVLNKFCSTDSTWKSKNLGISGSQDLHKHYE